MRQRKASPFFLLHNSPLFLSSFLGHRCHFSSQKLRTLVKWKKKKMIRKLIVFSFPLYFPGQREDKQQQQKKRDFSEKCVFLQELFRKIMHKAQRKGYFLP